MTTPPRPVDLEAAFPELADHARTATRLHPRPGSPGVHDSSVGGPLLWPADEPWPVCTRTHAFAEDLRSPADERLRRRLLDQARDDDAFTDELRAELRRLDERAPTSVPRELPLLAVAQLYARDVPDLHPPEGTDMVQVLWCPFEHDADLICPLAELRWRSSDVANPLTVQPGPTVMESDQYLPEPCVLRPEQITEYEYLGLLPYDLEQRIIAWQEETGHDYRWELALVGGWKVGGWARWNLSGPEVIECECGADLELLLAIDSGEHGGESWPPAEEGVRPDPTQIRIGRGYSLQILVCPTSYDHLGEQVKQ
ncbi:hypothetical protein [Spirillospora sp. NPDC047279]|uniref:hypothetical protein n=1 Tax=Spirillospora sp. NPDC047279 TaxID=3155478 RepID=UPI0033D90222